MIPYRLRYPKLNLQMKIVLSLCILAFITIQIPVHAQSLDMPSKRWGISFGNSTTFTGLRFNFRDSRVQRVTGLNFTLWQPREDNKHSLVQGISLGPIPGGGTLHGLQLGILGVAGMDEIRGISIGGLGIGCGGDMMGINIGGLGAGAGGSMIGINIGLMGMGAGEDVRGINIGGFGVGAGRDMSGFNFGGFGVGAGSNLSGINIGGLGAGAGKNMTGLNVAVLGLGAGENLTGINIAGLGAGAGEELRGVTLCGLGTGSPSVKGITIAGGAVGGVTVQGITMALGTVQIKEDGDLIGFAASGFNYIRGTQHGLSIAIVNYAYRLKGIQIGVINIVRDNPRGLKVLPIMNANF